jgi:diguanylate cyclase (GGDEF)-like protein
MHLDVLTLTFAGILVALIGAMMLFGAWIQMRRTSPALLWWTASYLVSALAVGLIAAGSVQRNVPLLSCGVALSVLAYGLIWAGLRRFYRRSMVDPVVLGLAAAAPIGAAVLMRHDPAAALKGAAFAATLCLLLASIWELWRGRADRFQARLGFMILLAIHGLICFGGLYEVLAGTFPKTDVPPLESWFGLINFEALFFYMGTAIVMLLICKEQIERGHMAAALKDGITGVPTRTAFLDAAMRLFERATRDGTPLSLILFDLDLFKRINDSYGHRTGDRVLSVFAEICGRTLRPNDLVGRYGGEEFVVILPGTTITAAYVIADRTRHAFAETTIEHDGRHIAATVSAGVATIRPGLSLDGLNDVADAALYRAKNGGRNRVESAAADAGSDAGAIRVA